MGTAGEWTRKYQDKHPGEVRAYFAGREILEQLLAQPGCMGIRIYYGLNGATPTLVLVGADQEENDQLGDGFIVADELKGCPDCCSQPNELNS
ncbi:hypothetical protein GCM10027345_21380 [Hymenobacter daeguensis]